MTWEAIEAAGGIQWGGERLYADGKFPTADGRAKLFAIECEPFPEQPTRDFPLILNTGRTVEHWHTRTKTGNVAILDSMSPRAWLEMNPRDAKKLGLKAHDDVSIVSRRSRVDRVELRVTEIVAPGQIFCLSLCRDQRQSRHTERLRPDFTRTELQTVLRARGAHCGACGSQINGSFSHHRERHGRSRLPRKYPVA